MLSFLHSKLFSSHRYICWVYNSKLEVIFPENFWLHYLLAFRTAVENSNAIVILDFSLQRFLEFLHPYFKISQLCALVGRHFSFNRLGINQALQSRNSYLEISLNSLDQESEKFSYKRQDNKYFRFCRPHSLCHNYSTLMF